MYPGHMANLQPISSTHVFGILPLNRVGPDKPGKKSAPGTGTLHALPYHAKWLHTTDSFGCMACCACHCIHHTSSTIITHFFVMEIFSDGTCYLKICYSNIIPVQRIFSIKILLFGLWLMVVFSLLTATAYLTLMLEGSLEHVKAFQQPLPIYLCMHDSHTHS